MGPKALRLLQEELQRQGLSLELEPAAGAAINADLVSEDTAQAVGKLRHDPLASSRPR